jgi:hypothetical protein
MSIKTYLNNYFKNQSGPMTDDQQMKAVSDYYYNYTNLPSTTTTTGTTLTSQQLQQAYSSASSTAAWTSSTVSSAWSNTWDKWGEKEKQALANVGFEYNKKTNQWKLKLSAEIEIPQLEGIMMMGHQEGATPSDIAITKIKQLKEKLIEKLTVKMILLELTKPREIKEE